MPWVAFWNTNEYPALTDADHWIGWVLWWLVSKPFTLYAAGLFACACSLPEKLSRPNPAAATATMAPA
ncbi:hypothetical protein OH786_34220 [Streptomyces atratus]|uniref:hypothetical protein n=1 Tax=Streptomyces atratus TaxID=1893 RepID=UPI003254150A